MSGTYQFFPVSDEDDEVDDRPIDTTDGWPEHAEDKYDPVLDEPPESYVTLLDEELEGAFDEQA